VPKGECEQTRAVGDRGTQTGGGVLEERTDKTKPPELFRVILHNDDYTTMDFVVEIIETVFAKSPAEAHRIMWLVHTKGFGVCGTYTYEVAETKVALVHDRARERGFPLRASIEEA
jgi:ATP-dependent Clp protease adaptor protein ClpS